MYDIKFDKKEAPYIFAIITSMIISIVIIMLFIDKTLLTANTYNSYVLQAQSWLSARLDLPIDYDYLELAYYNQKIYVSFPPFPSVIMLPFVLFFGQNTPDHLIAAIACIISLIFAFKLCRQFGLSNNIASFISLFTCLGSNYLFIQVQGGWVWYFAQNLAFMFTILSFYCANNKNDRITNYLAPFFLACSVGCRPFQLVYAPVVLVLLYIKNNKPNTRLMTFAINLLKWVIPAAFLCVFYLALNAARFGNIFEFGHNYLPEFTESEFGQFHTVYILENIKRLFRLPEWVNGSGIVFQRFDGTAFWLVSPIFLAFTFLYITIPIADRKKYSSSAAEALLIIIIPLCIILHMLLLCAHKTMGGWHFGNRYTIDTLPAVLLGISCILGKKGLSASSFFIILSTPLLFCGFLFNAIGTIILYKN